MWITPIYDRTSIDVQLVKDYNQQIIESGWDSLTIEQQSTWLTGLKGTLNAFDLNRIEGNTEHLVNILRAYGYGPNLDTFKVDWIEKDFPTKATLEKVRKNIQNLVSTYYAFTQVPTSIEFPTYQKINEIEKILQEVFDLIELMEQSFRYVGTFNANQKYNF